MSDSFIHIDIFIDFWTSKQQTISLAFACTLNECYVFLSHFLLIFYLFAAAAAPAAAVVVAFIYLFCSTYILHTVDSPCIMLLCVLYSFVLFWFLHSLCTFVLKHIVCAIRRQQIISPYSSVKTKRCFQCVFPSIDQQHNKNHVNTSIDAEIITVSNHLP